MNLAVDTLRKQTRPPDEIVVLNNIYPIRKAFCKAFDYVQENGDVIYYGAADMVYHPQALERQLALLKKNVFLVTAYTRDAIKKLGVGPLLYDMRIVKDLRPGKMGGPNAEWDGWFWRAVAKVSKKEKANVKGMVVDHHPIWTPKDMFGRMAATAPRNWNRPNIIHGYLQFFKWELRRYPDNKTLMVGKDILRRMIRKGLKKYIQYDKDPRVWHKQWNQFKKPYDLKGDEFYALEGWWDRAEEILNAKIEIPSGVTVIGG